MKKTFLIAATLAFASACSAETPAPLQTLIDQGVTVEREFDSEAGMKGYVVRIEDRFLVLYLTPDERHLLHGNLIDANGINLTSRHEQQHVPQPSFDDAWGALEQSEWVAEGNPDAPRVVYMFSDPNCPYCNQFREMALPYIGDDLQLRHVMVGVLGPDSAHKAAAILGADDPEAAMRQHGEKYASGGIPPMETVPTEIQQAISSNQQLMNQLGSRATPTIFWKDAQGKVRRIVGLPRSEEMLREIFE